jgi:hypothetical protein
MDLVQRLFPTGYPAIFRVAQDLIERASGSRH